MRWDGWRRSSERDSSFPGNEIVLRKEFCFGVRFAAGDLDDAVENLLAHLFDGGFAGDDSAGVDIDDVGHAAGELGIGGEFYDGRYGIAGRRAQAGGKQDNVGAGSDLRGDALDVIARRTLQVQTRLRRIF